MPSGKRSASLYGCAPGFMVSKGFLHPFYTPLCPYVRDHTHWTPHDIYTFLHVGQTQPVAAVL